MNKKTPPSINDWLKEAKNDPAAANVGMFLVHNGVVRETAKAKVRFNEENTKPVVGMEFSYDKEKLEKVVADAYNLPGIFYVKAWLNEGMLEVGDDIMYLLIGGDIRPNVVDALQTTVSKIKNECVVEKEIYG